MSLVLEKSGRGVFSLGDPRPNEEFFASGKWGTLYAAGQYAKNIGLDWQDENALQSMYFSLWLLERDEFTGNLSETPQAKCVEKLFGYSLDWRISFDQPVVCTFVDLYSIAYGNVPEAELTQSIREQQAAEDEAKRFSNLVSAIDLLLAQHEFIDDNEDTAWLTTRTKLAAEKELLQKNIEITSKVLRIAELRAHSARASISRHGGKIYSRPLDWKWRHISAFAAIMYFLAQQQAPKRKPRGRFGHGGDLPTYNEFLRGMAEGLVENWKTKTHLERLTPRPEHISQIDDSPLLLEISA